MYDNRYFCANGAIAMDIRRVPIIEDVRIYAIKRTSKPTGRRRLKELAAASVVHPVETASGRHLLTIEDAERLAAAL